MTIDLRYGDTIEQMKLIPEKSIDAIICDLPYGTTSCKWDSIIDLNLIWEQYRRIIKDNGAIVLNSTEPFTSVLICSNIKEFRYKWVWDKVNRYTGYANANKMPLKRHEDIVVFYRKLPTYNKQMIDGKPYKYTRKKNKGGAPELVPFTRQEIANFTGLRVETVIRALGKMHVEKKIEIKNHKIYY